MPASKAESASKHRAPDIVEAHEHIQSSNGTTLEQVKIALEARGKAASG